MHMVNCSNCKRMNVWFLLFQSGPSCLNAPGIESTLELSQIQDAREFCEKNSESVEVVYKELGEPVFARVHFRFDPKVH